MASHRRSDEAIELRPQLAVDATQAWFWTKRWQRMEREADEDIAAGKIQRFNTAQAFLYDLETDC